MHKPEYETICAFGTLCLNDDLYSIFKLNDLVNRGGLDSISCGAIAAFAVECYENGILTKEDTGGLELNWGRGDQIVKLVEMIIAREGIGDVLADGVRIAAEKIGKGAEKYAVHCGGVEPAMHDPKFDPGFASAYHCEPTPGRHTITSLQYLDMQFLEKKFSRAVKPAALTTNKSKYRYDDKAAGLAVGSFFKMLADCAGLCLFGTQVGCDMPIDEWLNAATGWNMTYDDYLIVGERAEQLRHAFNVREGINAIVDFKLHGRIYGEPPLEKGPAKGVTIDIDMMAKGIYQEMKWDVGSGKPLADHLKTLGLEDVAESIGA